MALINRLLARHLDDNRGSRPCYVDTELGKFTYQDVFAAAQAYAGALARADVPPGTRGLVVSDDSISAVVAILGLWWRGCVPVPVSPMHTAADIGFIAKDCDARFAHLDLPASGEDDLGPVEHGVVHHLDAGAVRRALSSGTPDLIGPVTAAGAPMPFQDDDEVLLQYTSGSTGAPRGVRHSLAGIDAVLSGFGASLDLQRDDVVMSTAKLSFGYGFGNSLLFPLAAGACTILRAGPADPITVAETLESHRPTVVFSVPRVYGGLTRMASSGHTEPMNSVRLAVSAGEHLPRELAERFDQTFGTPLVNGLGATEVLHIVVATEATERANGSTGYPVRGVAATVRDETGHIVPAGTMGRLHISGRTVALGYIDREEAERNTFADGGSYTGDIVCQSETGDIRYVCRSDDLLNLGGFKVSPAEIEDVIREVAGVSDCAVVVRTDSDGLAQAVAHAVPESGVDRNDLRRRIATAFRSRLPEFKRPGRIEVLEELPVTSTGKLARFELRDRSVVR